MTDVSQKPRRGKRRVVPVNPQWASQDTCGAWGLTHRKYLQLAKLLPHARVGQLVLVEAEVLNEALRSRLVTSAANDDSTDELSIDEVRASLGVSRA